MAKLRPLLFRPLLFRPLLFCPLLFCSIVCRKKRRETLGLRVNAGTGFPVNPFRKDRRTWIHNYGDI